MEVYDAFGPNQKECRKAQKLVHFLVYNLCVCARENNWDQSQSERTILDILLPFFFSGLFYSIFSDRLLQICAAHSLHLNILYVLHDCSYTDIIPFQCLAV